MPVLARDTAGVHGAVEAEIADGAAIEAATVGLQLFDDLHGADLGPPATSR